MSTTVLNPAESIAAVAPAPPPARLLIVAADWDKELRAAAYAIERAHHCDTLRVDVLYASAPVIAWQVLRFWAYGRVVSWQREQGDRLLHAYHDRLAAVGIVAACHVRIDEPAKAIPRLAAEISAECVVFPTPPATEVPPFGYWWDLHKVIRRSGIPIVLA
jgi:hypothetical protein